MKTLTKTLEKLASTGEIPGAVEDLRPLAKIAAQLDLGTGEFDITDALYSIGRKVYMKRAEWNMVAAGLQALKTLED